jgi:hypothetical protein
MMSEKQLTQQQTTEVISRPHPREWVNAHQEKLRKHTIPAIRAAKEKNAREYMGKRFAKKVRGHKHGEP